MLFFDVFPIKSLSFPFPDHCVVLSSVKVKSSKRRLLLVSFSFDFFFSSFFISRVIFVLSTTSVLSLGDINSASLNAAETSTAAVRRDAPVLNTVAATRSKGSLFWLDVVVRIRTSTCVCVTCSGQFSRRGFSLCFRSFTYSTTTSRALFSSSLILISPRFTFL